MEKVLGVDLGTDSIGWAIVQRHDTRYELLDRGVDIFQEGVARGDTGQEQPAVQQRTAARALRRHYARRRLRKIELLKVLVRHELCPPLTEEQLEEWKRRKVYPLTDEFLRWQRTDDRTDRNPYRDRYRALTETLDLATQHDRYAPRAGILPPRAAARLPEQPQGGGRRPRRGQGEGGHPGALGRDRRRRMRLCRHLFLRALSPRRADPHALHLAHGAPARRIPRPYARGSGCPTSCAERCGGRSSSNGRSNRRKGSSDGVRSRSARAAARRRIRASKSSACGRTSTTSASKRLPTRHRDRSTPRRSRPSHRSFSAKAVRISTSRISPRSWRAKAATPAKATASRRPTGSTSHGRPPSAARR